MLRPLTMPIMKDMMMGMNKVRKMAEMAMVTEQSMMIQVITMITMKPNTKMDMKKDMMKAMVKANRNTRKNKKKQNTNNL